MGGRTVKRQIVWLVILGSAVAAAVVYHLRTRSRAISSGPAWAPYAAGDPAVRPAAPTPDAQEAPTAAPATVVATMERPGAFAASPHEGNGSVVTAGVGASAVGSTHAAPMRVEPLSGPVVVPRRRGLSGTTLAALAAIAGAGAVALGAWGVATTISDDDATPSSTTPVALENVQQVVSLIGKPTTATIPVQGSGRKIILVVGASGYGVLVLNGLVSPPEGKTYQAWVIRPNVKAPAPAGIFTGGTGIVKLTERVPPGGVVAITVEPAGGSPAPTQQPKLVASRT